MSFYELVKKQGRLPLISRYKVRLYIMSKYQFKELQLKLTKDSFFTSPVYPLFIFAITLWSWFFNNELYGIIIFGLIAIYALVCSRDTLALLPIVLFLPIIESESNILRDLPIWLFISLGGIGVAFVVKTTMAKFKPVKLSLIWGLLAMMAAILISGFPYTGATFVDRLLVVGAWAGFVALYIVFSSKASKIVMLQLGYSLLLVGTFVSIQVIMNFMEYPSFWDAVSHRDLALAWGNANSIAILLLMTIPMSVYIMSIRRLNYLLAPLIALQVFSLLTTLSRGSILAFFLVLPLFVFLLIKESKNKLIAISVLILIVSVIFASIVVYPEIYDPIITRFSNIGFDDSGRFELFGEGLVAFFSKPLFGIGFNIASLQYTSIHYFHSTIIQTMASTGLIGLVSLIWHFDEKYMLVIKQKNHFFHWIAVVLLVTDIYGLIDVTYYTFIYMLYLGVILGVAQSAANSQLANDGDPTEVGK